MLDGYKFRAMSSSGHQTAAHILLPHRRVPLCASAAQPSLTPGSLLFASFPQGFGYVLRVSCVTPVLGPCLGFLGVSIASAVAGQVSVARLYFLCDSWMRCLVAGVAWFDLWAKHVAVRNDGCMECSVKGATKCTQVSVKTRAVIERGPEALSGLVPGRLVADARLEDVLLDAALGAGMFKLMGGRFRNVMPSNLAHPGELPRGRSASLRLRRLAHCPYHCMHRRSLQLPLAQHLHRRPPQLSPCCAGGPLSRAQAHGYLPHLARVRLSPAVSPPSPPMQAR